MTAATVYRPRVLADLVAGPWLCGAGGRRGTGCYPAALHPGAAEPADLRGSTISGRPGTAASGSWHAALPRGRGSRVFPWFSAQNAGIGFPSFGYIVGFVLAAVVVGLPAGRGGDRTLPRSIGLMVIGNLLIYAIGVPYLAIAIGSDDGEALRLGAVPFLVGDSLMILLAAGLLPAAWRLVGQHAR